MGRGDPFIGRVAAWTGLILFLWCGSVASGAPCGAALGPGILARQAQRVEDQPLAAATGEPATPGQYPATVRPLREQAARAWVSGIVLVAAAAAGWWIVRKRLADPCPPEAEPPPPTGGRAAIPWPLVMLAGLLVWLAQPLGAASALVLSGLPAGESPTLRGAALASLGSCTGALVAAAVALAATPGLARAIGLRPTAGAAARGLRAFCLIMPVVFAAAVVSMSIAGWVARWRGAEPPRELAHGTLRLIAEPAPGDGLWWALTVVGVVVGAPLVEELVYRGLFQTGLRRSLGGGRIGRHGASWGAILGSSAVFAMMHLSIAEPHALPTLLALSVALGIVYERTGRLVAPMIVHALFNAANIALVWLPG